MISRQIPTNVLSMLTRLRQLTLHPALVPKSYLTDLQSGDDDETQPAIHITPQDRIRLQAILAQAIEDNEECPVCFNVLTEPRITSCSHAYCLAWYVSVSYRL